MGIDILYINEYKIGTLKKGSSSNDLWSNNNLAFNGDLAK
jgi:hypothetical protein